MISLQYEMRRKQNQTLNLANGCIRKYEKTNAKNKMIRLMNLTLNLTLNLNLTLYLNLTLHVTLNLTTY